MDTNRKKAKFLKAFNERRAIIADACKVAKIARSTFYQWKETDKTFKTAVEEIEETQMDFVESKLLENIDGGDTTAIIFYLKSKGKKRGWNESYDRVATEGESGESYRVRAISPIELMERQENERRANAYFDEHPLTNFETLTVALHSPRDEEHRDLEITLDTEENAKELIKLLQRSIKKQKENFVEAVTGEITVYRSIYRTDIQKGFEKGWLTEEQYQQGLANFGECKSPLEDTDRETMVLAERIEQYQQRSAGECSKARHK